MKAKIFIVIILSLFLNSCKSKGTKMANPDQKQQLEGEWELNSINHPQQKIQELYYRGMPVIRFDVKQNIVSGNNGCNSFSGKFEGNGNTINLKGPMTATKMYCEGEGERVFMENLNKTESFTISKDGKTLQLKEKDLILLGFIKK